MHESCRRLHWLSLKVVNLAALEDADILVLARYYGTQFVTLTAGIGHCQSAHCTALGRAILNQLAPTEAFARISAISPFPVFTPNSKRNVAELMDDLEVTRERGYTIDDEENTLGLTSYAIALPRAGSSGSLYAVSVSLLRARETEEPRESLITDLRELVDTLARHERPSRPRRVDRTVAAHARCRGDRKLAMLAGLDRTSTVDRAKLSSDWLVRAAPLCLLGGGRDADQLEGPGLERRGLGEDL